MNFPNLKLTTAGIAAILEAVYSGETITFTNVKVGSGSTTTDPEDMTDLVDAELTVGISACTVTSQVATLEFSFNNATIDESFYLRELGIFAQVGEGEAFLYAYANAGTDAAYVKKYGEDDNVVMAFEETVAIGNAEHVTAIISGAVGYVTDEEFEEHLTDYNNPHRVTKAQVGLANVPNLTPSNMTVTFSQASTLKVPTSGSKLSVLMGLLSKAIRTLLDHLMDNTNPHAVSLAQIGGCSCTDYTVTVPITGWTGSTEPYKRSVTLNGILATDKPIIDIIPTGTWDTDEDMRDAWACIRRVSTEANKLNLEADSLPATAFTLQVRCIR